MFNLLFYVFTILSYTHLQHPSLTEARTQLPDDGFSVTLMHRFSPKSPFYNPSLSLRERFQQSVLASVSRHNQIKQLQNSLLDTSIITNQGDYLMSVYVGTPPVELVAVIDTALDLTWFQCTPCANCYKQNVPMLNPESSSTYQMLPCDSQHCSTLDTAHIACDSDSDQCLYWYTFGNQTSMTMGIMGNDTFSFSSSDEESPSFPLTVFGCGYEQVGEFDPQSAGVAGLGNGPLSLVSQLGYQIDYKFSYCLADATSNSTSKLRFGSINTGGQSAVTVPFLTKTPLSFYNLELNSISVGQMSVQVQNDIIIDTATTLTYVTPTIFSSLETMVNAAIGMKPMSNSLIDSVLCYVTTSGGVITPPDIVFHFSGGDLILKASNVFFVYEGSLCLSITATPDEDDPLIFGNMAQVNLEVEYDLVNKSVTFAQKDCTQDN